MFFCFFVVVCFFFCFCFFVFFCFFPTWYVIFLLSMYIIAYFSTDDDCSTPVQKKFKVNTLLSVKSSHDWVNREVDLEFFMNCLLYHGLG